MFDVSPLLLTLTVPLPLSLPPKGLPCWKDDSYIPVVFHACARQVLDHCPKKRRSGGRLTIAMANSKYEYVKSFEVEDEVMLPNLIVVRLDGRNFER